MIEKDLKLRKTLNFDIIDYKEYDKLSEDISKFYDDLIKNKVTTKSKYKLRSKLLVLSRDTKRLYKFIEKMIETIETTERSGKEMDHYTFVDKKFFKCFNDIGDNMNYYIDKFCIC